MAQTDIQLGGDRRLAVAIVAAPANDSATNYALLENDTSFTLTKSRDETKHSVKGAANKISATHQKDYALTCDGELVLTDPAFKAIDAAFEAGTPIKIQGRQPYLVGQVKTVKKAWEGMWNVISWETTNPMNGVVTVKAVLSPASDITPYADGQALSTT